MGKGFILKKFNKELQGKGEIYLRVKVHPGASRTQMKEILNDENGETIKLDIAEPAEKGKANRGLIEFLAKEFVVKKNNVKILSGLSSRIKLVKILKP